MRSNCARRDPEKTCFIVFAETETILYKTPIIFYALLEPSFGRNI